jgi:Protein of unknown function, DUF481
MSAEHGPPVRAIAAVAFTALLSLVVHAQGRTDVVTLANGDRITGEVVQLDRGRLEFKTDDAGTLYLEWDKLVSVVAERLVEVVTSNGSRFLGTLGRTGDGTIAVIGTEGVASLRIQDVTTIRTIGRSFWRKLDGSIDAGFSYTKSSGVAQLNFNSDTIYRRPAFQGRLTASLTATKKDDDTGRDDRGSLQLSYVRYRWREWFVTAVGRLETNESLGLELRSQIAAAVGPRLVNSNRAQMTVGAGLAFNNEQGVDVESTQNLEGLLNFATSFYTYDRPKTNLDVSAAYYPSLSNLGRHRFQLDASVKREFWKDLFLAVNMYNTFDSRPPNPDADKNDIGIVVSIGWSY